MYFPTLAYSKYLLQQVSLGLLVSREPQFRSYALGKQASSIQDKLVDKNDTATIVSPSPPSKKTPPKTKYYMLLEQKYLLSMTTSYGSIF